MMEREQNKITLSQARELALQIQEQADKERRDQLRLTLRRMAGEPGEPGDAEFWEEFHAESSPFRLNNIQYCPHCGGDL